MADITDIAQANETEIKPTLKYDFTAQSLKNCIDCDDEIPQARQKLGGVTRCAECQTWEDRK